MRMYFDSNRKTNERNTLAYFILFSFSYESLIKDEARNKHLESALQQALQEAADDKTFRKVKRLSYSANDTDDVSATFTLMRRPQTVE